MKDDDSPDGFEVIMPSEEEDEEDGEIPVDEEGLWFSKRIGLLFFEGYITLTDLTSFTDEIIEEQAKKKKERENYGHDPERA